MYKVGLIGYGSIGKRHVKNLLSLGINDIRLLRCNGKENEHNLKEYYSQEEFFKNNFDFVILSNPTSEHYEFLLQMISANQNIFCEKPVVNESYHVAELSKLLLNYKGKSIIDYNLRFHPCVFRTTQLLKDNIIGKVLFARFEVGQYLPNWRPNTNYSQSYSAKRKLGGGVTLDLIHEIDLAIHFFGEPKSQILSIADKFSSLNIETEDITEILFKTANKILVTIHLDYVYRGYKRRFEFIGENGNLIADLYANKICITGDKNAIILEESFPAFQRNDMYLEIMKYYLHCLNTNIEPSPDLKEGLTSASIAVRVLSDNKLI